VKIEVTQGNSRQSDPKSIPNERVYLLSRYDWSRIQQQTPLLIAKLDVWQILRVYEIKNPLHVQTYSSDTFGQPNII
jgi:hypothetical protein